MGAKKNYRRREDIPPEILKMLNQGARESATLVEALAVDFSQLMGSFCQEAQSVYDSFTLKSGGITQRMALAGEVLVRYGKLWDRLDEFYTHPSDTVRGWGCYMIARQPNLSLAERLVLMEPFARDNHFGVREWAWLALRDNVLHNTTRALNELISWAEHENCYLRRFASEITRPRGVWCKHIQLLKDQPSLGLVILQPLHSDPERYVQNSVANWLNDAAKSQPEWVETLCGSWLEDSPTAATRYICKRARRGL